MGEQVREVGESEAQPEYISLLPPSGSAVAAPAGNRRAGGEPSDDAAEGDDSNAQAVVRKPYWMSQCRSEAEREADGCLCLCL